MITYNVYLKNIIHTLSVGGYIQIESRKFTYTHIYI